MTINAAKCLPRWTNMGIIERKMISLIWDVGHVAVVKLEKKYFMKWKKNLSPVIIQLNLSKIVYHK